MEDFELLRQFIDWYRQRTIDSDGDVEEMDSHDIVCEFLDME